jgi:hypothetical protein
MPRRPAAGGRRPVADRDVVVDDDQRVLDREHLGGLFEIEQVAGVTLGDQQHAAAGVDVFGGHGDLVGVR